MQNKPLTREQVLETFMVLAIACLLFYHFTAWQPLLAVAFVLLVVGAFAKRLAAIVARWWMKLGHLLGTANAFVLLTLAFFVLLTPLALAYRFFNKDPLKLKKQTDPSASYYHDRQHTFVPKDLEHPW